MKAKKKRVSFIVAFIIFLISSFTFYMHTIWAFSVPQDVQATVISGTQIKLQWTPVNGAVGYIVFRSTDNLTYSQIRIVRTEGLIDGGLELEDGHVAVEYFYKIKAFDELGNESDYSAIASTTISPEDFEEFRNPHGPYSLDSDGCAACHSTHGAIGEYLLDEGSVTSLCYSCHDGVNSNIIVPDHKVSYDAVCISCHSDNMLMEKVKHYDNDCYGCHSSGVKKFFVATELQKDSCFSCHSQPHDVYMASVRGDIPLYPDVGWSKPQNVEAWRGEDWLHSIVNDENAEIIFSTRAELNKGIVFDYYTAKMTAAGWLMLESTYQEANNHFELTYSKGLRYAVIWYYTGDEPNSEESIPAKAHLTIAYH